MISGAIKVAQDSCQAVSQQARCGECDAALTRTHVIHNCKPSNDFWQRGFECGLGRLCAPQRKAGRSIKTYDKCAASTVSPISGMPTLSMRSAPLHTVGTSGCSHDMPEVDAEADFAQITQHAIRQQTLRDGRAARRRKNHQSQSYAG